MEFFLDTVYTMSNAVDDTTLPILSITAPADAKATEKNEATTSCTLSKIDQDHVEEGTNTNDDLEFDSLRTQHGGTVAHVVAAFHSESVDKKTCVETSETKSEDITKDDVPTETIDTEKEDTTLVDGFCSFIGFDRSETKSVNIPGETKQTTTEDTTPSVSNDANLDVFLTVVRIHSLNSTSGKTLNNKLAIVIGKNNDGTRAKLQIASTGINKNIKWSNIESLPNEANCLLPTPPVIEFYTSFLQNEETKKSLRVSNLAHLASKAGRLDCIHWLHQLNEVVEYKETDENTFLDRYLTNISLDPIDFRKLKVINATIFSKVDSSGKPPLYLACELNYLPPRTGQPGTKESVIYPATDIGTDLATFLLEKCGDDVALDITKEYPAGPEQDEEYYFTCLSNACHCNNLSMVKILHKFGARCFTHEGEKSIPFFDAVKFASSLKICKYLVQNGAKRRDVRFVDGLGGTPVLFAARWENLELLKYIVLDQHTLKFRAMEDCRRSTSTGRTLLGVCFVNGSSENRFEEIAKFLILICNCTPAMDPMRCSIKSRRSIFASSINPNMVNPNREDCRNSTGENLVKWAEAVLLDFNGTIQERKKRCQEMNEIMLQKYELDLMVANGVLDVEFNYTGNFYITEKERTLIDTFSVILKRMGNQLDKNFSTIVEAKIKKKKQIESLSEFVSVD